MPHETDLRALPGSLLSDAHDYVFVVTYGRTGSTLVQGLLNALPRTLVRGENGMFHVHQWRAAEAAVSVAERNLGSRPRQPTSAFYGGHLLTTARFVESTRAFTKELLLGRKRARAYDRLGFKEIRWYEIEPAENEGFFAWFEQVFPGARYVLNTRDPEQTAGSGFWQKLDPDEAEQRMIRVREIQDFLRRTRPDRYVDTHYEVITGEDTAASDAELTRLATFVTGKPCDKKLLASLRTVLETGHGPNPFGASRGRRGRTKE